MKYEAKACPVCGSVEIKMLSQERIGEDVFVEYLCASCDGIFKTEKPIQKEPEKPKEPAIPEIVLPKNASAVDIFKEKAKFVVEITCANEKYVKYGSGVLLDSGDILSNAHLTRFDEHEAGDLTITATSGGAITKLDVIAIDVARDLILFHPSESIGTGLAVESKLPDTGERCFAIGNPKGQGISIFEGIVSANDRKVGEFRYIMFSAPVTQGNSGGPLFDSKGSLIGIVSFGREDATGMNYAIPSRAIQGFLYYARRRE